MKKFEMPEIQVVTFEEDIMALNVMSSADTFLGDANSFTQDNKTGGSAGDGWF